MSGRCVLTLAAQRPWKTETQATPVCHLFFPSRGYNSVDRAQRETLQQETRSLGKKRKKTVEKLCFTPGFLASVSEFTNKLPRLVNKMPFFLCEERTENRVKVYTGDPVTCQFHRLYNYMMGRINFAIFTAQRLCCDLQVLVCHSSVYRVLCHSW